MYPFTSNLYDNQQLKVYKQCTKSFFKTTPKTTKITIPELKQLPEEAVL